jgi:hypothetical protein
VQLSRKFIVEILEQTVLELHELVAVAVLGVALGGYLALVVSFGLLAALLGAAFYLALIVLVVVAAPRTPARWSFPTLLPERVRAWLQEERIQARHRV